MLNDIVDVAGCRDKQHANQPESTSPTTQVNKVIILSVIIIFIIISIEILCCRYWGPYMARCNKGTVQSSYSLEGPMSCPGCQNNLFCFYHWFPARFLSNSNSQAQRRGGHTGLLPSPDSVPTSERKTARGPAYKTIQVPTCEQLQSGNPRPRYNWRGYGLEPVPKGSKYIILHI